MKRHRQGIFASVQFAVAGSSHNNKEVQFREGGQRGVNGGAQAHVGLKETGECLTVKLGPARQKIL